MMGRNPAHSGERIQIPASRQAEVQGRQRPQGLAQLSADTLLFNVDRPPRSPRIGRLNPGTAPAPVILAQAREDRSQDWLRRTLAHAPVGPTTRAVSSVGRAPRLHRGGRRFEPVIAHHDCTIEANDKKSGRNGRGEGPQAAPFFFWGCSQGCCSNALSQVRAVLAASGCAWRGRLSSDSSRLMSAIAMTANDPERTSALVGG